MRDSSISRAGDSCVSGILCLAVSTNPQVFASLSIAASKRLDNNKGKSHVAEGDHGKKAQLLPDSPIKPDLRFSLRHKQREVEELLGSKAWWKWNTVKSWCGAASAPRASSSALHASLWAVILVLILQMAKRPWRVQHALATYPVGLWSSPPSLPLGQIQAFAQICTAQGLSASPPGPCFSQPAFLCKLQWNGKGAIPGLLGRKEETGLGRWSAQDSPGRATGLERETGLEPKANNPFIIVPGLVLTQLLLCAVEEIAALGSWEVVQDPMLKEKLSPQPQTTREVCSAAVQELVWRGWGPTMPCIRGFSAGKEHFLLSVGFSSSPLWKWRGKKNYQ